MLVQLRTGGPSSPPVEGWTPSDPPPTAGPLRDALHRTVRYVRISLTDRCNLRCTYCIPEGGIPHAARDTLLSFEEIESLARLLAARGVTKVRLTGGEPTLRRDLPALVARLRTIPCAGTGDGRLGVYLTTNGVRLEALAPALAQAQLSGLTVSLDTLVPERFHRIARADVFGKVRAGIAAAVNARIPGLKLNTVAIKGFNHDELGALCAFAWDHQMVPRFIETMPMGAGSLYVPGALMPAAEVRAEIERSLGVILRGSLEAPPSDSGPARYWEVEDGRWANRQVGTIGAMTENFCGQCNRLRISAQGDVHGCLAHDDAISLRSHLRGPSGLQGADAALDTALGVKRKGHNFELDGSGGPAKQMIGIGG